MKITDRRAAAIGGGAAVGSRPGAGSGFKVQQPTAAEGTARPALASLRDVTGVLAIHAAADPALRRARAVRRADEMLTGLEELRLGLLDGELSPAVLDRLAALLAQERGAGNDRDGLRAAIAEIEQRVAVELAKLGR